MPPADGNASGLTSAELRVLPLLQTHLSFREIGERQFVSRNTIKTQAISIYRKLGVSSRSGAIERAAELGPDRRRSSTRPRPSSSAPGDASGRREEWNPGSGMVLTLAIILALVLPYPANLAVLVLGAAGEVGEIVWGRRLAKRWRPKVGARR